MGDEKQYTIQIKGTAYRFKPLPPEDLTMVMAVLNLGASQLKTLKALSTILARAAGPEQWDAITDRLIAGEVDVSDVTVTVFEKLIRRAAKDGIASTADDAE